MGEAAFLIAGLGLGMPQQARKGSQTPQSLADNRFYLHHLCAVSRALVEQGLGRALYEAEAT
jgi:hypothetical protein